MDSVVQKIDPWLLSLNFQTVTIIEYSFGTGLR